MRLTTPGVFAALWRKLQCSPVLFDRAAPRDSLAAKLHRVILGTVEVMAGYFAGRAVTTTDFLHFLVWATLGNSIGGAVFVAFIKYGHTQPDAQTLPST